jgi:hypothetical protein
MLIKAMTERAQTRATDLVARMDEDGDGLLSAAEMLMGPGPERMLDRMDSDGDYAMTR